MCRTMKEALGVLPLYMSLNAVEEAIFPYRCRSHGKGPPGRMIGENMAGLRSKCSGSKT